MTLLNKLRRVGWANLLPFLAALLAGLIGIFGPQAWLPRDILIVALLTMLTGILYLVYSRLVVEVDDALRNVGGASLDTLILPRRERIRSGAALSFESLKRPGVQVLVAGISSINFLAENESDIREALEKGAEFHFVFVDPQVKFLGQYDVNLPNQSKEADVRSDIERAVAKVQALARSGRAKYKLYPGVPMYSAVWEQAKGSILVEFYTYGGAPANRPGFLLERENSPRWYAFFERSLNSLWDASRPGEEVSAKNPSDPSGESR